MDAPTEVLAEALVETRAKYPEADALVPLWTPASGVSAVHVEVWTKCEFSGERSAKVVPA